jgi:hypothetical protein
MLSAGMVLRVTLTACLLAGLIAACGGSDDPVVDAAAPDATITIDADLPDAADPCAVLCECAVDACDFVMEDCLATCVGLSASVRTCRTMHCGYAQQNPTFHCPHVAGDPDSPGVPAACISP